MTFRQAETELGRRMKRLIAPAVVVGIVAAGLSINGLIGGFEDRAPNQAEGQPQSKSSHAILAALERALVPIALADLPQSLESMEPVHTASAITIASGDTLMNALVRAGADRRDAYSAIEAMNTHFNPRRLRVGQSLDLTFLDDGTGQSRLVGLALEQDIDRRLEVLHSDEAGWQADVVEQPLQRLTLRASGQIDDSLFLAAAREGVPAAVIVELIRIFSFDVDFQREIRAGDHFEIYFERHATADGSRLRDGSVLYGSLTLSGRKIALYRYQPDGSERADYYHADGESARRMLIRTPVDGARLSSRFGPRRHPVLGYNRVHRGVDFAAPPGTPIMAAGDGVVERADWYGSYGRYVRIRHNGTYQTAYAHMRAFGKGMRAGARVRQGQVIGYIGASGRVTGPHLHYEVHKSGEQVNPLSLELPTGDALKGPVLEAFNGYREALDVEIASIPLPFEVADSVARDRDG
ncbi:MAG: peptidoglycan DD-metalloendopeptidase family protein [Sphingomonadales bacterium]